jgi:hypothetical protein
VRITRVLGYHTLDAALIAITFLRAKNRVILACVDHAFIQISNAAGKVVDRKYAPALCSPSSSMPIRI